MWRKLLLILLLPIGLGCFLPLLEAAQGPDKKDPPKNPEEIIQSLRYSLKFELLRMDENYGGISTPRLGLIYPFVWSEKNSPEAAIRMFEAEVETVQKITGVKIPMMALMIRADFDEMKRKEGGHGEVGGYTVLPAKKGDIGTDGAYSMYLQTHWVKPDIIRHELGHIAFDMLRMSREQPNWLLNEGTAYYVQSLGTFPDDVREVFRREGMLPRMELLAAESDAKKRFAARPSSAATVLWLRHVKGMELKNLVMLAVKDVPTLGKEDIAAVRCWDAFARGVLRAPCESAAGFEELLLAGPFPPDVVRLYRDQDHERALQLCGELYRKSKGITDVACSSLTLDKVLGETQREWPTEARELYLSYLLEQGERIFASQSRGYSVELHKVLKEHQAVTIEEVCRPRARPLEKTELQLLRRRMQATAWAVVYHSALDSGVPLKHLRSAVYNQTAKDRQIRTAVAEILPDLLKRLQRK